ALATMDFPSGIFIDLFPLDPLSDDESMYKRQVYGAWFFNKLAIAKLTRSPFIAAKGAVGAAMGAAATVARVVLNAPGIRGLDPNNVARKLLAATEGERTRRVGYPCDTVATWCVYDADDLFPVRHVPFEDMTVPVPNHIEDLLTQLYGDWMQPPSNDVRIAHYPDILDFGVYANV
ncbi:MAG: LicD family protein, partial [Eggerthellaceae bacterium]|nr:LicD family protein [Eggerthellaceae bacterium]